MVCLRIVSACACTVHSQLQPYSLQKLLQESHISAPVRPTLRGTVFNGAPSGMDGEAIGLRPFLVCKLIEKRRAACVF